MIGFEKSHEKAHFFKNSFTWYTERPQETKQWTDVISHFREKGNQDCLHHSFCVFKDPCRENSFLESIQFSVTISGLGTAAKQFSSLVIICPNDTVFSYYILPYGNPSQKYADHGLISMKLLYHKITGMLSSEARGIDFLVSLHGFHFCTADSHPCSGSCALQR